MTNDIPTVDKRAARRKLFDTADEPALRRLIAEHLAYLDELAVKQRQRNADNLARGLALPPNGWPEIAAQVDEGVWLRILGESPPDLRAELEAIRPPARGRLTDG
jgi:hypothetical protein